MNLSAPTTIVFIISLVLAVVSLVIQYGDVNIAGIAAYYWALVGYIVLAAGVLLKGL